MPQARRFGTIYSGIGRDPGPKYRARRDEALRRLAEHRDELAAMGAGSLSLFGSVARDEARPDSDVDILIELSRPMGLFGLTAIQLRLEEILGRRVELMTTNGMAERYRSRIVPDLIRAT